MSGYQTVLVGTDGSDSSLRAVDKAGQIAAGSGAKVIVATAYFPQSEDHRAADVLKDEGYKMSGNAPIYAILREAKDRAKAAGASEVEEKADRRRAGRRPRRSCRGGQCGPSGRRQRRPQHHRRPAARLGARQRRAAVEDRRADRSHHALVASGGWFPLAVGRLPATHSPRSRGGVDAGGDPIALETVSASAVGRRATRGQGHRQMWISDPGVGPPRGARSWHESEDRS